MAVTKLAAPAVAVAASDSKLHDDVAKPDPPKPRREELQMPPWRWLSLVVMVAYFATFAEAVLVCSTSLDVSATLRARNHLCAIYVIEALMAVWPGWCAMQGWTRPDVLVHHVPYLVAQVIGVATGNWKSWTMTMRVSLLTAANEGMLVVVALGGPETVSKFRRLYGFSIVAFLVSVEVYNYFEVMWHHLVEGNSLLRMLPEQWIIPAIWYHASLLRAYIRRWRKTKTL